MSVLDEDFDTILVESPADYLGHIILNRPDKLNTISPDLMEDLEAAVDALEADDDFRTIYITGAGEKAFSAGADLSGGGGGSDQSRRGHEVFGLLRESPMPVVAGIDGYCLGGGMELSMCADLRVASESSEIGLPEHNRGLFPGWGGTQRLQRLIGEAAAKQVIFTGEHFSADRMHELGYLTEVYSDDEFEEKALEFATNLAGGPPIAQRLTKRSCTRAGATSRTDWNSRPKPSPS
ncbi:MAG: enoyl-CoA hydratase/isomerase family protein [Natrialbaceae archaeon]|nr:enoyl-CoA hydratase/isomerase family protein [Natrialbaceae archaeon]